jgi:hypothetical protein
MKRLLGILMMVGLWSGCGGDKEGPTASNQEITTAPDGTPLEVKTIEWDNGNIKKEFQCYRDGGAVIRHGYYKEYDEVGTLLLEGTHKEGNRVGDWMTYDDDGNISYIANTPIEDLHGCEGFEKDELLEMEAIIYEQRGRALDENHNEYLKAGSPEQTDSLRTIAICLRAILTDRYNEPGEPDSYPNYFNDID